MEEIKDSHLKEISNNDILHEKLKNKNVFFEFWSYLKVRKKWWLLPIIIMLLIVGILILIGQSSSLSPFVYAFG